MNDIFEMIDKEKLFADYDYLGSIPETGFDLPKTYEYVRGALSDMGMENSKCGKCGISAVSGNNNAKKTLLIRADMDAIHIEGKGNMHGCGHHMHTAILLATARIIKNNEDKLKSRVKLMFQPAEEILEGAADMIDSGILRNPKPDAACMIHVSTGNNLPTGTLVFASGGEIAPSADFFTIKICGKGSHGADPSKGIDPIACSAQVISSVSFINSREISVFEPAVITFGSVKGGKSANAIPEEVVIKGTIRSYSEENRNFVKKRFEDICTNVCKAHRCSCDISYDGGCPPFVNDENLTKLFSGYARELFSDDMVINLPPDKKGGGSEDFSYISQKIPSVMISLAAGEISKGHKYPLHNPNVSFDKEALPYGVALLTHIAFNFC